MSEHDHQVTVFQWAELQERTYPELAALFAVPNGSNKSKAVAGRMRAEGLKSGVPDICLPVARGKYGALFIEMKDGNKKPTENQVAWMEMLDRFGNCVAICQSASEAIKTLEWYLMGAQ